MTPTEMGEWLGSLWKSGRLKLHTDYTGGYRAIYFVRHPRTSLANLHFERREDGNVCLLSPAKYSKLEGCRGFLYEAIKAQYTDDNIRLSYGESALMMVSVEQTNAECVLSAVRHLNHIGSEVGFYETEILPMGSSHNYKLFLFILDKKWISSCFAISLYTMFMRASTIWHITQDFPAHPLGIRELAENLFGALSNVRPASVQGRYSSVDGVLLALADKKANYAYVALENHDELAELTKSSSLRPQLFHDIGILSLIYEMERQVYYKEYVKPNHTVYTQDEFVCEAARRCVSKIEKAKKAA